MKFVPLIPSNVAGPLGVKHLPRLWLKVSLATQDKLHADYHAGGRGFDQLVLGTLGLTEEDFTGYIRRSRPSYPELEAWLVREHGASLDPVKIAALNRQIEEYHHRDDTRQAILDAAGLADDGSIRSATALNNLDDWGLFYREILA